MLKKTNPAYRVVVIERNKADDTFGWGVVFSDQTLANLGGGDEVTQARIVESFVHWDDIDIHFKGRILTSGGHGFCGIGRKHLLNILQDRARELGVELQFETDVTDVSRLGDADLIVASDGVKSHIRATFADVFRPHVERRTNRFIWLGTHKAFHAFTFIFVETPHGWFQAHAYSFDQNTSTFIVETRQETWRAAGLDGADTAATLAFCENVFAGWLDGFGLISNSRLGHDWMNFSRVSNETWVKDNVVLMGDAAHSAHFSIGSGTKLALEDAIALNNALLRYGNVSQALHTYETERRIDVLKIQSAARNSTEWFEHVDRYARLEPEQFAYSLLTRSQRVSHENLRLRDSAHVERVEQWLAERCLASNGPERNGAIAETIEPAASTRKRSSHPMFLPFRLRNMRLVNRVVVSPMAMYSAKEGIPNDFHLVHFGSRAMGGAGLVVTEMTCVTPNGRITPGCAGLWNDTQRDAWAAIVRFIHEHSAAKFCLQLGHSGPKGSTKVGWEGADQPLDEGNWDLLAPSAIAWSARNQLPIGMSRGDMDAVRDAFTAAAVRGDQAHFDMLELHAAHGYLLSAFISPLLNRRDDDYGGSLENRLRFPLEIFRAVRAAWPGDKPMSVRISASDWVTGGITGHDAVEIARAFAAARCDLIDVSAGQTSMEAQPAYGRMFQTPFSDAIRNEVGIATMAVGNITEPDQVNSIIAAGRADLVALARTHLSDPHFTLRAAAGLGYTAQCWPKPYLPGKEQLERISARRESEARALI